MSDCVSSPDPMVGITGSLTFADDAAAIMLRHIKTIRSAIAPEQEKDEVGRHEEKEEAAAAMARALKRRRGQRLSQKTDVFRSFLEDAAQSTPGKVDLARLAPVEGEHSRRDVAAATDDGQVDIAESVNHLLNRCEEMMSYMKDAQLAARHQRAILDDTLTLSKIDAGKLDFRLAPSDHSVIIDSAISIMRSYGQIKGLDLITEPLRPSKIQEVLKSLSSLEAIRPWGKGSGNTLECSAGYFRTPAFDELKKNYQRFYGSITLHEQRLALLGEEIGQGQKIPTDICLESDARHIVHILVNLLSNGIKYTHAGSVTLRSEICPLTSEDMAKLQVSDSYHSKQCFVGSLASFHIFVCVC